MTCHQLWRNTRPLLLINRPPKCCPWATYQTRRASSYKVQRRDDFWMPTVSLKKQDENVDATQLLIRAGYLRQAYSGIFHMLPLGLRVQEKLEDLIDKHMKSIGASKVSLSSISSQALWQKSGRLNAGSELFKFSDRKDAKWLLAPTHEEEITTLVADIVHSPHQLPIRLYQISRKYRDEKRPRGGLLRGREFIMKDLYTFDIGQSEAHATYDNVRQAYRNFLGDLKIQYVEARADSGNMGGTLSHEYHFPSQSGEDDVISCDACDYARNEEWVPECDCRVEDVTAKDSLAENDQISKTTQFSTTEVIGKSQTCLVKVYAPRKTEGNQLVGINTYAIKAAMTGILELDTGVEYPRQAFAEAISHPTSPDKGMVYYLFDPQIEETQAHALIRKDSAWRADNGIGAKMVVINPGNSTSLSLLKQVSGDKCPQCHDGVLKVEKAIEIGHTFHLGTRYSSKLGLKVKTSDQATEPTPIEMGCHGIGVSRLVAAVAASLSDQTGLNWPRAIAPFEAILIVDANDTQKSQVASAIYDALASDPQDVVDTLLDDRTNVSMGYKLKDADLIGYPVILIVGKTWQKSQQVEVQCRRLGVRENVKLDQVSTRVRELLNQL